MKKESKSPAVAVNPHQRLLRRIVGVLIALAVAVLVFLLVRHLVLFRFYDEYRRFLPKEAVSEKGKEFQPLPEETADVPGMALAAENDLLKLYVNPDTAEAAVYDKRNGQIIRTNPENADKDPKANGTNRNYLKSQLLVDYYNASRVAGTYASQNMSVDKGQLTVESIENGVRFVYGLGDIPVIEFYVPRYLTVEWFDKITAAVEEKDARTLDRMYKLSNGINGMYGLIDNAQTSRKSQQTVYEVMVKGGFGPEDYYEMQELGGVEPEEYQYFTVPLEYRLVGDALEVTVPTRDITEQGGAKIYGIQLLRAFGAAGTDEEGYMVVPGGTGALINFNNGKTTVPAYSQYIYDLDPLESDYVSTQNVEMARLPLFGICRENSGILATVESGASYACVKADVSGRLNSYNTIYASFTVRGYSLLSMFGVSGMDADLPVVEDEIYPEDLTVRYTFLTEENKGYSGLANAYRNRLMEAGILTQKEAGGDIPFYYDVIGGVKQTAHFIGIAYGKVYPMTTFAQAEEMAKALQQNGVSNQVMNLQGWFNGGYFHDAPSSIRVEGELGGKAGLETLTKTVEALGGEVYADVAFQNVSAIAKGYTPNQENSRYYASGYAVQLGQLIPTTLRRTGSFGYRETISNLISPRFLPRYTEGFAAAIKDFNVTGISLRDLGDELHSDKRRTNVISREQALNVVQGQFALLSDTGKKLMVSGGNAYSFGYAKHIVNAPMDATEFFIVDQEIPLYQMILHGCVDYAGISFNAADTDDWEKQYLQCIEYGASCHYTFTWQRATEMKHTGMFMHYSTWFEDWGEEAARVYQKLNDALSPVSGALMIEHSVLENGVVRVTYDNGISMYINSGDSPKTADGITIPAMDYVMGGEDA